MAPIAMWPWAVVALLGCAGCRRAEENGNLGGVGSAAVRRMIVSSWNGLNLDLKQQIQSDIAAFDTRLSDASERRVFEHVAKLELRSLMLERNSPLLTGDWHVLFEHGTTPLLMEEMVHLPGLEDYRGFVSRHTSISIDKQVRNFIDVTVGNGDEVRHVVLLSRWIPNVAKAGAAFTEIVDDGAARLQESPDAHQRRHVQVTYVDEDMLVLRQCDSLTGQVDLTGVEIYVRSAPSPNDWFANAAAIAEATMLPASPHSTPTDEARGDVGDLDGHKPAKLTEVEEDDEGPVGYEHPVKFVSDFDDVEGRHPAHFVYGLHDDEGQVVHVTQPSQSAKDVAGLADSRVDQVLEAGGSATD